ncbi:NADH kinase pos5 [Umbelopsis nana]
MFGQATLDHLPHEILTCIFIWSSNNELPLVSKALYHNLHNASIGTKVDFLLARHGNKPVEAAAQGGKFRFFNLTVLKRLDQLNGSRIVLKDKRIPSNLFTQSNISDDSYQLIEELLLRGCSSTLPEGLPIIKSCQLGHLRMVKLLVAHGADPYARNCLALRTAAVRENYTIINYLLDDLQMTPDTLTLKVCVKRGKMKVADILMAHGAVPDMETLNNASSSFVPVLTKSQDTSNILQLPGDSHGGSFLLSWRQRPRTVLIIKKPNDSKTEAALTAASWLHDQHPDLNILVEPDVAEHFREKLPFVYVIPNEQKKEYTRVVDFAITLGGDGTMLHVSSLFPKAAPPVLSFSMGTLGFLMPFDIQNYRSVLKEVIDNKKDLSLLLRMRLFCSLHLPNGQRLVRDGVEICDRQVMNELTLHRGKSPHLTAIECFVDGQYLTDAIADGLIISTPTGSTAYSLSAGGPIVHPSVDTLVVTPICPRSLSFRTVLLPTSSRIQLKIGENSKSPVEVSMDGREIYMLERGEYLQVRMSKYPMPCINRVNEGVDWVKDINDLLKWNQNFEQKLLN